MRETRDSVALGMREAETHQLRSAIKDLRELYEKKRLQCLMYEIALKKIADYDGKHTMKDIAVNVLGGYGEA
jgi:hypothetical protein